LAIAACESAASSSGEASSSSTATDTSTTGAPADAWSVALELGPELGMAMSVWGPSADEVRVVGGQQGDAPSAGFVLRNDGGTFVPESLPDGTPMLNWIGHAGDDIWIVGLDGAALRLEDGAWVAHDTGTDVTLWGVWGATTDDAWAVGGDGVSEAPTLLHWDGAWQIVALPTLPESSHGLFKVWGADAEHVFVVGDGGAALRRNGGSWVADETQSVAPIISVWGRSADDVVAVGGRSNARVLRWDGAAWGDATLVPAGLNGVWIDDDGVGILVGRQGNIFELAAGSLEPTMIESPTHLLLHAVHGFVGGPRFAVGGTFDTPPPWRGVVLARPAE
jgi:hypothetical protein